MVVICDVKLEMRVVPCLQPGLEVTRTRAEEGVDDLALVELLVGEDGVEVALHLDPGALQSSAVG